VHDILVRLGVARFVIHIPAEGLEEWVDELPASLGFVVLVAAVALAISLESFNKLA